MATKFTKIKIQHEVETPGHYMKYPFEFSVDPSGSKRVNIFTVPGYTDGVDVLEGTLHVTSDMDGDYVNEIDCKIGQVATVVEVDAPGSKVTLRSSVGVLKTTRKKGGKIDEGFRLSFGNETLDPDSPLEDYGIKTIGTPSGVSGGNEDVEIELFDWPSTDPVVNDAANLVVPYLGAPMRLFSGQTVRLGVETTQGSNLPSGKVIQMDYQRNAGASGTIAGQISYLY